MGRIPAIALLVAGILMVIFGLNASDSIVSEFSEIFTGSPSSKAIWLMILGVIFTITGGFWMSRGRE